MIGAIPDHWSPTRSLSPLASPRRAGGSFLKFQSENCKKDVKNVPLKSIFLQIVWLSQRKAVHLHRQNPPRFPKTSEPGRGVFYI